VCKWGPGRSWRRTTDDAPPSRFSKEYPEQRNAQRSGGLFTSMVDHTKSGLLERIPLVPVEKRASVKRHRGGGVLWVSGDQGHDGAFIVGLELTKTSSMGR